MKNWKSLLTGLIMVSVLLACGKKKNSDEAAVQAGRDTRSADVTGATGIPSGSGTLGTGAFVTTTDQYSAAFNEAIKVLVSPTMPDLTKVGNVSHRDGVTLQGNVQIGSNGMVTGGAASVIQLTIRDDLKDSNGNKYEPIVIKVNAISGNAYNGNVNIVFSDEYGTITIAGTYSNGGQFNGGVHFKNVSRGYMGKSEGTLGQFSMPTCNFFKCQ